MKIQRTSTVELVDHLGDDLRVCAAARVSTGAQASKGPEQDKKLINYLMKHDHQSPFEGIVFTFKISMPIFIARQLLRHRIASPNEASARYREMDTVFFLPGIWRKQNTEGNKQGSGGLFTSQECDLLNRITMTAYEKCEEAYHEMLQMGVAKELARTVLPVGLYTEIFWTINFRSLMNFIRLRKDSHSQPEIQEIAQQVEDLVKPLIPWSYEAFETHVLKK